MQGSALQKTFIYAIGAVGNSLALTLLVPYLVHALSQDEFGAWSLAEVTVMLLSTIVVLGMDVGLMKEYWYANEQEERRRLIGTILSAQASLSLLLLGCCFALIALPQPHAWLMRIVAIPGAERWVGLVTGISVLEGQFGLLLTVFRIRESAATFVALSIGRVVTLVAFAVVGIHIVGGVTGALLGRVLCSAISVVAGAFLLRKEIVLCLDWRRLRRALGYGLPLVPTGLASYVLFASDRYFLQSLRGLGTVAVYTFAYKVASVVDLLITRPFATDWAPRRFKIASEGSAEKKYATALVAYLFCATALGSALIAATPYTYWLLAPPGYAPGMRVVPVIVAAYIIYGLSYPLNVGIMLKDRTGVLPVIGCVSVAVCIVLNLLLIPNLGMAGAAWATLGSYVIWTGLIAGVSLKYFPIRYPLAPVWIVVAGGVVASLGQAGIAKTVASEPCVKSLLLSSGWVCAIVALIAYALWGRWLEFPSFLRGRTDG